MTFALTQLCATRTFQKLVLIVSGYSMYLIFSTTQEKIEVKHKIGISPIQTLIITLFLLAGGIVFPPGPANAETVKAQQWNITADKMTRYENPPSIIAEGNVVLEKTQEVVKDKAKSEDWGALLEEESEPQIAPETEFITETQTLTSIKADWIVYDVNLGTVKARGNLLIDVGTDQLEAETGEVDLNRETGTFKNAAIIRQQQDLHLEGRVIEKTGDITYHIEDGWVITCKLKDGETPPWSFAAKDAEITDGGYAVMKHATFRVKDIPILYTPIMILPVKRTRQTGFLFPEISSSDRDGFGINLPFFLNLSPSSDMTLYPYYMEKRGLMTGLEFRYVKAQDAKGGLMVNYLYDNLSDPSEREYYKDGNYTHTNKERYWIRGKADQDISGWVTRVDLDIVSDRDYLTEFNAGLTGFTTSNDRFLEVFGRGFESRSIDERKNTIRTLKSWKNMSIEGQLLGINDLRESKNNPTPLWQLPSINWTGLVPLGETLVNLDWDTNYVNYWRKNGVGAHRFDIYPRITAPIPLSDYLETTAELGVRDTAYFMQEYGDSGWQGDKSENRLLFDFETEIGTTLVRDFDINISDVNAWSHTFRPYVNYLYIPDVYQGDLPQFDDVDAIYDENLVTYGLDNFFKIFGTRNGSEYERDYGEIKISQGYSFRSQEEDTPLTPVNLKLSYWPMQDFRLIYKTDIDVYGDGAVYYSLEGNYKNSRGDSVAADYRYDKYSNINSIAANAKVNLFYNLLAGYSIERSIEDSKTVEEIIALIYQPSCWSVELSSNYTPGDQTIMVTFRLANIGNPLGIDMPGF